MDGPVIRSELCLGHWACIEEVLRDVGETHVERRLSHFPCVRSS